MTILYKKDLEKYLSDGADVVIRALKDEKGYFFDVVPFYDGFPYVSTYQYKDRGLFARCLRAEDFKDSIDFMGDYEKGVEEFRDAMDYYREIGVLGVEGSILKKSTAYLSDGGQATLKIE